MPVTTTTSSRPNGSPPSPCRLTNAIVNARKRSEFTGAEATFDPVVSGKFTAWDKYISGTNVELVRGRLIVQHWRTTEWPEGYPLFSQLVWTFEPKNDGTEVTLVHSYVPESQAAAYRQGRPLWRN